MTYKQDTISKSTVIAKGLYSFMEGPCPSVNDANQIRMELQNHIEQAPQNASILAETIMNHYAHKLNLLCDLYEAI